MVSQLFCPRPYRSACDDARSRSAAAHRRGSGHTADVLHEGRPTPRGWGSTGRGLCVLHDSPTYVEYTHPSPSSPRPSCSGQRLRDRDRHGTVDICEITADRPYCGHTPATVRQHSGQPSGRYSLISPVTRIAGCEDRSLSVPRLASTRDRFLPHASRSAGGALSVVYGMLVAFLALAALWWGQTRSTETYGIPGPTTTLTLSSSARSATEEQQLTAARQLRALLTQEGVSMVKASQGDGDPILVVLDPKQRIDWTGPLNTDSCSGLFAIRGTYSSTVWRTRGQAPLAPAGRTVLGTVSIPGVTPSTSSLQFVEPLGSAPLGTGQLLLGTTDPALIARVSSVLEESGLTVESTQRQPALVSLVRDTTVATAALFAVLGIVCTVMSLALSLPEQRGEIRLRRMVGATEAALVRERCGRELLRVIAGTAAGALGAGAAAALVAQAPLSPPELGVLVVGAVVGGAVLWMARLLTFAIWLRLGLRGAGA